MDNHVSESIAALQSIRIIESGEPLVSLLDYKTILVRPSILPYVRQGVAERLVEAQARLPQGYRLKVIRAFRTLEMQREHWDEYIASLKAHHRKWPLNILRRETNRAYAPYDAEVPPGHCTGGAVDVVLIGPDGTCGDLVPPLEDWDLGHTGSTLVSSERQGLRKTLCRAMTGAGFSNYPLEYWHYSYGDSAWALRTGHTTCPYGLVTLQKEG